MSESQRRKGKAGERSVRLLLQERDYDVYPRPRGEAGDDFTAIKDGVAFSVEVKNCKSLSHAMWAQCKKQAGKRPRILAWHPSGWDFPANAWLLFFWPKGDKPYVRCWFTNEPDLDYSTDGGS